MPRLSLNLQLKLLLPVLLGTIPALIVLVVLGRAYHAEAIEQSKQTLLIQAQRLAEHHQAIIDLSERMLATMATDPILQAMENPACEQRLAELYQPVQDVLANLLVMRPDGRAGGLQRQGPRQAS